MKKLLVSLLAMLVLVGCASESSQESVETTVKTEEKEDTKKNQEELIKPTIKGSNAYDIIESLETTAGIGKPDTKKISDGYSWDAVNTEYSYHINANEKHEISIAEFYVLSGDSALLGFCGSMPYDSAEPQKAMDWVNANVGKEVEKQFGDAIYSLSNGEKGAVLKITAEGYNDYLIKKMSESNN